MIKHNLRFWVLYQVKWILSLKAIFWCMVRTPERFAGSLSRAFKTSCSPSDGSMVFMVAALPCNPRSFRRLLTVVALIVSLVSICPPGEGLEMDLIWMPYSANRRFDIVPLFVNFSRWYFMSAAFRVSLSAPAWVQSYLVLAKYNIEWQKSWLTKIMLIFPSRIAIEGRIRHSTLQTQTQSKGQEFNTTTKSLAFIDLWQLWEYPSVWGYNLWNCDCGSGVNQSNSKSNLKLEWKC